ncbi:caspase recruitment domain-containing protein 6 [Saccopteryx leptura]|uniref:caspase recruitment domain-containing protein 6 n=1 Tax=Saccopteryx leptura TaxID=249018 RepID=UPI00339CAB38
MATGRAPSEIIERERKKLLEILQQDLDSILDSLTSRRLISEDEYETLEDITDPLKKSRKLLILVQKKGEVSCELFLKCLLSTFPESATIVGLRHEFLNLEKIEPSQSVGVSKNLEDLLSPGERKPEKSEITVSLKEQEHLDLETSEMFMDKKTGYREMAWSSSENEKEYSSPTVALPQSLENVDYEVSANIDYLQDGERYDEVDDSLYVGGEDYLEAVIYYEDVVGPVEEEEDTDPEHLDCDEEDPAYSETTEFSGEEQGDEDLETGMSLEEEEDRSMEERIKVFQDVLSRLNMDRSRKVLPDFVKQFSLDRGCKWTPATPGDLAWNFLMKVQALDVTAREPFLRHQALCEESQGESPPGGENVEIQDTQAINPLDVICASLLCSDSTLQRRVMSSMHRCRFALPLLLPEAENNKSILMLGAMQDIVQKQPASSSGGPTGSTEQSLTLIKMPVVSFVRLGDCCLSKSRTLNTLLSPAPQKPQRIFLHGATPARALARQISDGLVEIAWCFPDGDNGNENLLYFQDPVAVANLRGDLESFWTQFGFLMEVSSAVFFFTDSLGEKEWDLLMFLGEAAIERCYFVLSPQAKESEEAQVFQRVLKLKPSQLLFWEEEEDTGETGRNIEGLRAALREVMSSSLRCVSVEDMASLAWELGIQVDRDVEDAQETHVSPRENSAETAEGEGQPICGQPESTSDRPAVTPVTEPGAVCEVSQVLRDFHLSPVTTPPLPFAVRFGGHSNHAALKAPWGMGSHFGSEQKSKWFRPSPFQNSRVHSRGRSFGIQYFQPQRFCSGESFMKFLRPPQGHHMGGLFGRPPRPICWRAQAWPGRPQTMGACNRSAAVVTQGGRPHSLGSQRAGPAGKPQPGQAHTRGAQRAGPAGKPQPGQAGTRGAQGTGPAGKTQPGRARTWGAQPTQATGRVMRTTLCTGNPPSQTFQPSGVLQKPVRPAFQQGLKLKTQGGPFNPAVQMRFHPKSDTRFLPSSPFSQPKPSQGKPSQPKPTHTSPPQSQPSQAKCSPSKPTQPKPCQPQASHSKPSQPRASQPKSLRSASSQVKASSSRAGPRGGRKR